MECVPTDSEGIVKLAVPLLTDTDPDICVLPSKNSTVPDAPEGVIVARNVTGLPDLTSVSLSPISSSTVVFALETVWPKEAEMEALVFASPLYWTTMEWVPAPRVELLKLTEPLVSGMLPEIGTLPSKKVTVPVADAGATPAVKVSAAPNTEGLAPVLKTTVVAEFAFGLLMVWVRAVDTAASKVASPLYCAMMEWVPIASVEIVKLADPDERDIAPEMGVPPSMNVTVPVAEAGEMFAVKVSESPLREGFVPVVSAIPTLALALSTF